MDDAPSSPAAPTPPLRGDDTPAVAAALLARFRETAEARVAELVCGGQVRVCVGVWARWEGGVFCLALTNLPSSQPSSSSPPYDATLAGLASLAAAAAPPLLDALLAWRKDALAAAAADAAAAAATTPPPATTCCWPGGWRLKPCFWMQQQLLSAKVARRWLPVKWELWLRLRGTGRCTRRLMCPPAPRLLRRGWPPHDPAWWRVRRPCWEDWRRPHPQGGWQT